GTVETVAVLAEHLVAGRAAPGHRALHAAGDVALPAHRDRGLAGLVAGVGHDDRAAGGDARDVQLGDADAAAEGALRLVGGAGDGDAEPAGRAGGHGQLLRVAGRPYLLAQLAGVGLDHDLGGRWPDRLGVEHHPDRAGLLRLGEGDLQ